MSGESQKKEDSLLGQVFAGKYRIEELLGVGGMSAVYAAHQIELDRMWQAEMMASLQPAMDKDPALKEALDKELDSVLQLTK